MSPGRMCVKKRKDFCSCGIARRPSYHRSLRRRRSVLSTRTPLVKCMVESETAKASIPMMRKPASSLASLLTPILKSRVCGQGQGYHFRSSIRRWKYRCCLYHNSTQSKRTRSTAHGGPTARVDRPRVGQSSKAEGCYAAWTGVNKRESHLRR